MTGHQNGKASLGNASSDAGIISEGLVLHDPDADSARLVLFWETAQYLKQILAELPQVTDPRMRVQPVVPRLAMETAGSLTELMNASVSSEVEIGFKNLSEPVFERLALRFRPFFANDEDINVLKIINILARHNAALHDWAGEFKRKWKRAVFWGAMGMPGGELTVSADEIINAGLYSRYIHVKGEMRAKAAVYEKSIGTDLFRVALVSSVWQRARLVMGVADAIEPMLINSQLITAEKAHMLGTPLEQPTEIVLKLKGGVGAIQMRDLPPGEDPRKP